MAQPAIKDEIAKELDRLSPQEQQRVLDFVHDLATNTESSDGTPSKELLEHAGSITPEDAEEMLRAIEEEWEQGDDLTMSSPKAIPGERMFRLAGILPDEDAQEMLRAIEDACEQMDMADMNER